MAKKRVVSKRKEQAPTENRTWMIAGGIGGLIILGGLIVLMVQAAVPSSTPSQTPTPIPEIPGLVQASEPLGRAHDENLRLEFGELPPMGGSHNPIWQNCGIYTNPVLPEHAIHTLEHGAVWITHQPDLDESEVEALIALVRNRSYILFTPYPEQRSPIVLTAWGVQLEVESAADERIMQFVEIFEQGPQTPEPGGACTGGLGFTTAG